MTDSRRGRTLCGFAWVPTHADERINGFARWSVVILGWVPGLLTTPTTGQYVAFSVEEMPTVNENE